MKPRILSTARLSFTLASAIAAMLAPKAAQAQQYWRIDGTGAAINTANWGSLPTGPFTSAFTANGDIVFGANSAITGATVNIGNITVVDGVTVNFTAAGTLGTNGAVRTLDVGTGATLNLAGQAISTTAGFIKNGMGTLSLTGSAYTGGFTLNAGTVALGGINAMGAGGALTINGGAIRSSGTAARDLSGKYAGGITIGGDFALGDATNNGLITFSNNMALGGATRTITTASNAVLGGIISGDTGVGITKQGTGTLTLSGANTFSGGLTIRNGTVNATTSSSALGAGTITMGGAGSTGATLTIGRAFTNSFIINAPDSGSVVIGANGNGSGYTLSGGIALNGNLTIQTFTNTGAGVASAGITGGITGTGNVILNNLGPNANVINITTAGINHAGSLTVQGSGTGNTTINSVIGSNVTSLTAISTASRLVLTGDNASAFALGSTLGTGTANVGSVAIGHNNALGTGKIISKGAVILADGGDRVLGNAVDVDAGGFRFGGTNNLTFNGVLTTVGSTRTIDNQTGNKTLTLAGGISNTFGVTFEGNAGNVANGSFVVSAAISGNGTVATSADFQNGVLALTATNTYFGATTINAGTLYVSGALSSSAVTVGATGTIGSNGGSGTLGNGLTIAAGGNLDLTGATLAANSSGILSLTGDTLTLGNLTFQDLVGWDWLNAVEGTYELIDGSFSVDFGTTAYLDAGSAYDFGNGKSGYFTQGSLNVVIIPEPRAALLGGLGMLVLLRRRRH